MEIEFLKAVKVVAKTNYRDEAMKFLARNGYKVHTMTYDTGIVTILAVKKIGSAEPILTMEDVIFTPSDVEDLLPKNWVGDWAVG